MLAAAVILMLAVVWATGVYGATGAGNEDKASVTTGTGTTGAGQVSIMFTSDMHSHLDTDNGIGGAAKLKTATDKIRAEYPGSFLFDGGDFSMGTAYQTIATREA